MSSFLVPVLWEDCDCTSCESHVGPLVRKFWLISNKFITDEHCVKRLRQKKQIIILLYLRTQQKESGQCLTHLANFEKKYQILMKKDTFRSTEDGSLKTDGAWVKRPLVTPINRTDGRWLDKRIDRNCSLVYQMLNWLDILSGQKWPNHKYLQ